MGDYVHPVFNPGARVVISFSEPPVFAQEFDYGYLEGRHGCVVRRTHIPYLNQPTYEVILDSEDFYVSSLEFTGHPPIYVVEDVYVIKATDLAAEDAYNLFMDYKGG